MPFFIRTLAKKKLAAAIQSVVPRRYFVDSADGSEAKRRIEQRARSFSTLPMVDGFGARLGDEKRAMISALAGRLQAFRNLEIEDSVAEVIVLPDRSISGRGYQVGGQSSWRGDAPQSTVVLYWGDVLDGIISLSDGICAVTSSLAEVLDLSDGVRDGVPAGVMPGDAFAWKIAYADALSRSDLEGAELGSALTVPETVLFSEALPAVTESAESRLAVAPELCALVRHYLVPK